MAIYTYNAGDVIALWGVIDLMAESAPDVGVSFQPDGPIWTYVAGVDGEMIPMRVKNLSGKFFATLTAHGTTHLKLFTACTVDALSGFGAAPLLYRDPASGINLVAPLARPVAIPELSSKDGASVVRWEFACPVVDLLPTPPIGGTL